MYGDSLIRDSSDSNPRFYDILAGESLSPANIKS